MIRTNLKLARDLCPDLHDHLQSIHPRVRAEFCRQLLCRGWERQHTPQPKLDMPVGEANGTASQSSDYLDALGEAVATFS